MEKEIKELNVSTLQSNKFLVFVHVHTKKPPTFLSPKYFVIKLCKNQLLALMSEG